DPRTGELLERPLVTAFPAPRSYTGEDVVELSTHGGPTAPAAVLAALDAGGAREALPGEFTRRAVLNGELHLAQAAAVAVLIDSLAGEARAIVTDVPGTTRDALEVLLDVEVPNAPDAKAWAAARWPLRLVDTAGLHDTTDRVERAGIELSERWVRRAHVVLA